MNAAQRATSSGRMGRIRAFLPSLSVSTDSFCGMAIFPRLPFGLTIARFGVGREPANGLLEALDDGLRSFRRSDRRAESHADPPAELRTRAVLRPGFERAADRGRHGRDARTCEQQADAELERLDLARRR